jgi:predicted esterase
VLLAPQALGTTWDFIWGTYGVDVAAIDRALAKVFRDVAVDPARVSLTGFSDGASYALSLGLTNGDLFTRLVAFSPGILAPAAYNGKPAVFVSHGTRDQILSIDRCSRRFVPKLRGDGYAVTYREFDGPHTVPPNIAEEAARFVASV